jgi:hypothetical protein
MQPKALGTAALAAVLVGAALVSPHWYPGSLTAVPRAARPAVTEQRQHSVPALPAKQTKSQVQLESQPKPPETSDSSTDNNPTF